MVSFLTLVHMSSSVVQLSSFLSRGLSVWHPSCGQFQISGTLQWLFHMACLSVRFPRISYTLLCVLLCGIVPQSFYLTVALALLTRTAFITEKRDRCDRQQRQHLQRWATTIKMVSIHGSTHHNSQSLQSRIQRWCWLQSTRSRENIWSRWRTSR